MEDKDLHKSVVSRIALTIRRCYCMHSRWARQIDRYDPPDHKYGKYWTNAAISCVTNRIHPAEYIEVLFAATRPRWPEIRQIASAWALELYRKNMEQHANRERNKFDLQIHAFSLITSRGIDPVAVLTDERREFDSLFIYAAAEANGLTELAESVKEGALAKYLTSVHYDYIYKDMIPDSFKRTAIKMREGTDVRRMD